jgi:hypothetical protein
MRILLEEAGGHVYIVEEPARLLDLKLDCLRRRLRVGDYEQHRRQPARGVVSSLQGSKPIRPSLMITSFSVRPVLSEAADHSGMQRLSQPVPKSNLVSSVLNSSSIICSKVFPSSSFARLTSLPFSSTYSASTGNSATLATTFSSTIFPFSS